MPNTGKLADPEWRRERARRAGQATQSPDSYIRALVKRAPQLTESHRSQLRALLASTNGGQQTNG